MARTMRVAVVSALAIVVALAYVPSASADAASGIEYLASTQDTSGGWDAGGSEFVTSEAILAIAEVAQSGAAWSRTDAFGSVAWCPESG